MSKLDESGIISMIQKVLGNAEFTPEDVESFPVRDTNMVVKTDTLVQSTDIPKKMSLRDAARKSIVACVSDFASKGARPLYCVMSLNLPKDVSDIQVRQIAQGMRQASREFGIKVLGGDTNQGREFVFNACVFGTAERIIPRSGAKPDEIIFVSGPFGYAAAGLAIMQKNKKAEKRFKLDAVRSFARPRPRLDFALQSKGYFTSSMDSSDGLSSTLNQMARQSGCRFVLDKIPADGRVEKFAKLNRLDMEQLVFHAGEEYEFAFTTPERHRNAICRNAESTGTPIFEIGRVKRGRGVFVKDGRLKRLQDLGWRHFR